MNRKEFLLRILVMSSRLHLFPPPGQQWNVTEEGRRGKGCQGGDREFRIGE
jgi:hypothetical protein